MRKHQQPIDADLRRRRDHKQLRNKVLEKEALKYRDGKGKERAEKSKRSATLTELVAESEKLGLYDVKEHNS